MKIMKFLPRRVRYFDGDGTETRKVSFPTPTQIIAFALVALALFMILAAVKSVFKPED